MSWSSLLYVTTLPSLVVIGIVTVEIKCFQFALWFRKIAKFKESFKVSQQVAKFGGLRHCGSEAIIVLVCHMILEDHVTKESSNFMGGDC